MLTKARNDEMPRNLLRFLINTSIYTAFILQSAPMKFLFQIIL